MGHSIITASMKIDGPDLSLEGFNATNDLCFKDQFLGPLKPASVRFLRSATTRPRFKSIFSS